MSIFKTRAIVLKIDTRSSIDMESKRNNDSLKYKNFIYTIFSYEFGKIRCLKKISKKEKNIDLGYIIDLEVETKKENSLSKMKSVKIINQFDSNNKDFKTINGFLALLGLIIKKLPEGLCNKEVFEIIEEVILNKKINKSKIVLSKLKVLNVLGELKIDNKNDVVQKILKFVNGNKIEDVLRIKGIENEVLRELEIIVS